MTPRRRALVLSAAWTVMIFAGTAYLTRAQPGRIPRLLELMAGSEPVHVVAHVVLYGVLALGLTGLLGHRLVLVPPAVLGIAFLQECLQVVLFKRRLGRPEVFDLVVDLVAIVTVVLLVAWRRRRRPAPPEA